MCFEMHSESSAVGDDVCSSDGLPVRGPQNSSSTTVSAEPESSLNPIEFSHLEDLKGDLNGGRGLSESIDHGEEAVAKVNANLKAFLGKEKIQGTLPRELGVTWKDLTVTGANTDAAIHENFVSQFDVPRMILKSRHVSAPRNILDKCHGCVKPGEMLLVLGRPGSGCTTLLSMLANRRRGYSSISGDVSFGSMNPKTAERYAGQIVMNTEQELFFPSLTVGQTMDFATRLKVPANVPQDEKEAYRKEYRDLLLHALDIEHTFNTKVGNEYIRGISGGQRKRVSIAECLATRGSVFCWDNSSSGLDASTALQFIGVLRALTSARGLSTIVTLYQPGNGIYDLFDKVLVLDEGQQVYYGPMSAARPFMEGLGFECLPGVNTADYLTGITVPAEREVRPECLSNFPRSGKRVRELYEDSTICQQMATEYDYPYTELAKRKTLTFQKLIADETCGGLFTVSFLTQVRVCVIRQYQVLWGDKKTFFSKLASSTILALILGSLFYDAPSNSAGLFIKSGALFFALLYNTLIAMSEVADSFNGRPVLLKHKYFAFNRLAAYHIAQILADIPVIAIRITTFSIVLYFMVGLKHTASAFFTYWIVLFITALTMTALFRAIGATSSTFDKASKWAGIAIGSANLYTGYMLNYHQMHPWFIWLFWIDPLAYAFDSLLSNELHGDIIDCVGSNLVPFGPGYASTGAGHQSCANVGGAVQGRISLTGDQYLESLTYSHSHVWRNFGILWPMWIFLVSVTILFSLRWHFSSDGHIPLLIPREKVKGARRASAIDEEAIKPTPEIQYQLSCEDHSKPSRQSDPEKSNEMGGERQLAHDGPQPSTAAQIEEGISGKLVRNTSILTWRNLSYTVKTSTGDSVLLNDVHGWVKPGMLGALMGASGAGKTTLLDVLAQRKSEGVISGSILVDGMPLPVSFQRRIGFCEQVDVHEPFSTIREALEFSALLRQDRQVSRQEKLDYVQTIIDLLELNDLADTMIGRTNAGLTLEQRKRVTIGVELVSKPQVLIFLDEPTTGSDSQAAFSTVRFLRKLADLGQAVLVTIHQPSAQVFSLFDTLLLLSKGGKVAYFGETGGKTAQTLKHYFTNHGAPQFPIDANPAEYVIDLVSSSQAQNQDWNKVWIESAEYAKVLKELARIESNASGIKSATSSHENDEFASPLWEQMKMVTYRTSLSLLRNTDYVNNKLMLHIFSALFNGFSFWMISDSASDLHSRLFAIFNFIFVAPGALNQLQPLFIERRDIFETREAKSKIYSWFAFATAVVFSEIPYLCVCAFLYLVCWYWTVGLPTDRAGQTFFVMIMYEFVFTGLGEFVAACAPNASFASFASPVLIGFLVPFCGILVPYAEIQAFWRYWLYYINPFTYLMGSMLTFGIWGTPVTCSESEFAIFNPVNGTTCGEYLKPYLAGAGAGSNLVNPDALADCRVCQYKDGSDYLETLNLTDYSFAWRDAGIVVAYAVFAYAMVFLSMGLRARKPKKA